MVRLPSPFLFIAPLLLVLSLSACGGRGAGPAPEIIVDPPPPAPVVLTEVASLGANLFRDRSLSASGQMACNTCHNAGQAYAQTNDLAVQLGGPKMGLPGTRAVPSLRYMAQTPAFHFDANGRPVGGFNRDGRAGSLVAQAERPFVAMHEMANGTTAEVVDRLSRSENAAEFRRVYGANIFSDPVLAYARLTQAIAQFQVESPDFAPFTSKYDHYLAGKLPLDAQELRGLAVFNDRNKGNCAACHPSARGPNGEAPLFTDFGYGNLGVPRNPAIPANADPAYYDLGLCGPDRQDLAARRDLCGQFKTPTLRNVATRQVFFHNGVFNDLRKVLRFYVMRDVRPEDWYPRNAIGMIERFNDMPIELRKYVDIATPPYNRGPSMLPALSDAEIEDLLAFLNTLNDGYVIRQ